MNPVTRRSVTTGLAAAVAVVPIAIVAKGAKASATDPMAVWQRYMDAECKLTVLQDRDDRVRAIVCDEWEVMEPPWTPRNQKAWDHKANFNTPAIKAAEKARA